MKYDFRSLEVFLTNRCNMTCPFCPIYNSRKTNQDLSIQDFSNILAFCKSKFPHLTKVSFTGGEPLLLRNLPLFIDEAEHQGITEMRLFTNGTISNLQVFSRFTEIIVSLHSISHQQATVKTLTNLPKELKKRIKITTVLHQQTELEQVANLAQTQNYRISLAFIKPFTTNGAYKISKNIPTEDALQLYPNLFSICRQHKHFITEPCKHLMQKKLALQRGLWHWTQPCLVPLKTLIISCDGSIRLCNGDQPPIGTLTNFPKVLESERAFELLTQAENRQGTCSTCMYGVEICQRCIKPKQLMQYVIHRAKWFKSYFFARSAT